jgi:L-arabinokinase
MDVMGGIADYSGSLLLQMPIRQRTFATVQRSDDEWIWVKSKRSSGRYAAFKMNAREISDLSNSELSRLLKERDQGDWASYVIGSVAVLYRKGLIPVTGLTIKIESSVPEGKGVSSSAALEVAVISSLVRLFQVKTEQYDIPLLAQQAENEVVGAPCGLMDQLSTYFGEKGKLLPVLCQPCAVNRSVYLPADLRLCAIDSGVRHSVGGDSYSGVRTAAFMAYAIIARSEGVSEELIQKARATGEWDALPYGGYLSNIPLSRFKQRYLHLLPEKMKGEEYIQRYAVHTDRFTEIKPDQWYSLRACALHPVEENARIGVFRELVSALSRTKDKKACMSLLGELMLQSHAGYSSVGLGNEKTDMLVDMLTAAGKNAGIYGARVSGGGNGGTVVVVCKGAEGVRNTRDVWMRYNKNEKSKTLFFTGSSQGTCYS